jgi:hypothetical protein
MAAAFLGEPVETLREITPGRLEAALLDFYEAAFGPTLDGTVRCEACGEPCKRGDLPTGVEVVYAGDSHSDLCASLAADRVFATANLARWLGERNVPYRPLTDFHALASEL